MKFTYERKAKLIVFLNALTLIGGLITILLLFRIIGNTAAQNLENDNRTQSTNKQIVKSQAAIEKELGCLAAFFSQTNRQNLRISNLKTCQILHTDTQQTEYLPVVPISSIRPAMAANGSKQNGVSTPTQSKLPNNKTAPGQASLQATGSAAGGNASTKVELSPAVKVLGVPVCIPFTNLCARK